MAVIMENFSSAVYRISKSPGLQKPVGADGRFLGKLPNLYFVTSFSSL